MKRTILEIEGMDIGHKDRILFSDVHLEIHEGDCIMLCGANGSGKTTFLKLLAEHSKGRCEACLVPSRIPKNKGFTVREFIRISCFRQTDMAGKLSDDDEKTLEASLQETGIHHLADRDLSTLSDGEFQKAGIAAALVRRADLLMLDEPTAFLDAENRISVLQTLRRLCDREKAPAVMFSTHDLHDGLEACTKVVALGADGIFRTAGNEERKAAIDSIFRKN